MTQTDILEELKKLTNAERLAIAEAALRLIRDELEQEAHLDRSAARRRQLEAAARALLADYTEDGELTAFTSLDGEDFYAEGRSLAD